MNSAVFGIELNEQESTEVREFFFKTYSNRLEQDELNAFLDQLSPSKKLKIQNYIYFGIVQENICIIRLFPPEDELQVKTKFNMKHWFTTMCRPENVSATEEENLRLQFLYGLVERFSTALYTPEETVIKQGDPGEAVYFIASGDVAINLTDHKMEEIIAYKLLIAGDHFGEISLIYDCITQASCVSRNYLSLAVLSKHHFNEFVVD